MVGIAGTLLRPFKGTVNRMINGYLLRDVINKINGIHFNSTEEITRLSTLREHVEGNAGRRRGQWRVLHAQGCGSVNGGGHQSQAGEVILDPACGTGGFLTESYAHLRNSARPSRTGKHFKKRASSGVRPSHFPICWPR